MVRFPDPPQEVPPQEISGRTVAIGAGVIDLEQMRAEFGGG